MTRTPRLDWHYFQVVEQPLFFGRLGVKYRENCKSPEKEKYRNSEWKQIGDVVKFQRLTSL